MTEQIDVEFDDEGVTREADVPGGVLVGHDGSECAQEALQWAARLAARAGFPLHVLRAWKITTAPRPATWAPGYVPPFEDFEKAVRADLEADVSAAALDPALTVTCHVTHGTAVRGLIESAGRADPRVVGARGPAGFARLGLRSGSAPCPPHPPRPGPVVPTGPGP